MKETLEEEYLFTPKCFVNDFNLIVKNIQNKNKSLLNVCSNRIFEINSTNSISFMVKNKEIICLKIRPQYIRIYHLD